MNKAIFTIRNLTRAYGDRTVLKVPELDIPRGELVAILGNSGCGKTTFLEILGLMSQPPVQSSQVKFHPKEEKIELNYHDLWQDERRLSQARRDYFTFIFQQTNLLPEFFVDENISLTQIIQDSDKSLDEAMEITHNKMAEVEIGDKIGEVSPKQLSGGQQQRAAFARAVAPEYTVLFGDEPTGNLGEKDADKIFENIRKYIDKNAGQQTAIIVTHNVDLALKFADRLIIMQQDGLIKKENIFKSKSTVEGRKWPDLPSDLQTIMDRTANTNGSETNQRSEALTASNGRASKTHGNEFSRLFRRKVGKELSIRNRNGMVLIAVFFVVFCAIAFAKGSLFYLKEKMSDPFVKWLDIEITSQHLDKYHTIVDTLLSTRAQKDFRVQSVNGYYHYGMHIDDPERRGTYLVFGRTIEYDDPLLRKIGNEENLLRGSIFKSDKDASLIVTERLMRDFGYDENDVFIQMSFAMGDGTDRLVPMPIRGVVKELPGNNLFVSTHFFYDQRYYDLANPYNPRQTKDLKLLILGEQKEAWTLKDSLDNFFSRSGKRLAAQSPFTFPPEPFDEALKSGFVVRASFNPEPNLNVLDTVLNVFRQSPQAQPFKFFQLYEHRFGNMAASNRYDRLAVNVASLDEIARLKVFLYETFELDIDMARIESLENYNFVTKLTNTTSVLLIIISLITICIFVSYILYIHLYKMRVYIGSFKAFGVDNKILQKIYLQKMLGFVGGSMLVALIGAMIFGYSGGLWMLLSAFYGLEKGNIYFNLQNLTVLVLVLAVFVSSFFALLWTANKILKHSPGDLIYDRLDGKSQT